MLVKSIVEPREGSPNPAELRRLDFADLTDALEHGWSDFLAFPSFGIVVAVIYPIVGLLTARVLHGYSILPFLFPIAGGFALLGPFATLIFYDISRRRDLGEPASNISVYDLTKSPSRRSVAMLGGVLAVLFLIWLGVAQAIYNHFYGFAPVASMSDFVMQVVTTSKGLTFFFSMCGTGFLLALISFCISVVSFPLLLERNASATDAMLTSFRVIAKSPLVLLGWGFMIAILLLAGSVPAFLGLAVVVPVLGHATWHLYRRAVP